MTDYLGGHSGLKSEKSENKCTNCFHQSRFGIFFEMSENNHGEDGR